MKDAIEVVKETVEVAEAVYKKKSALRRVITRALGIDPEYIALEAKAKASAKFYEGKADADVEIYREKNIPSLQQAHLKNVIENRAALFELNKTIAQQTNRESICAKAIVQIENLDQITENGEINDIDADWLSQFWESAQNVSREHMQEVWAKVLLQEALKPNSYSPRALATLKLMIESEAKIFAKLCESSFDGTGVIIFGNQIEYLPKIGLEYHDLLILSAAGVIDAFPWGAHKYGFVAIDSIIDIDIADTRIIIKTNEDELDYPVIAFTPVGVELCNLIEPKTNMIYLDALIASIKKKYEVSIFDSNPINASAYEKRQQ